MDQISIGDSYGDDAEAAEDRRSHPLESEQFRSTVRALWQRARDHADDELAPALEKVWRYYDGQVSQEPAFFVGFDEQGRRVFHGSAAVVRECWDKVQAVLPDLARIFLGSAEIVNYVAKKPEDEKVVDQATDYANYVLWSGNDGEQLLLDTLILWLLKFCVLKVCWREESREEVNHFTGLSDVSFATLQRDMQSPGSAIVLLEGRPRLMSVPIAFPDGQGGTLPASVPQMVYDGRMVRQVSEGRIAIELLAHEEFLIDPDARKETEALFVGTDTYRTVSDVVELGVPYETVLEHAGSGNGRFGRQSQVELARRGRSAHTARGGTGDPALDYVRVIEAVTHADVDGDGRAERWRVLMLGENPELIAAEQGDDVFYIVSSPYRRPHEPVGDGLAEVVMDLQEQKTGLIRGIINNLNRAMIPREVHRDTDDSAAADLASPLNGPIRSSSPAELAFHVTPYVGQQAFPLVQYFDEVSASRTGVTLAGQGLDPGVLKGQTVEGARAVVTAPQSRIEFLAREFAAGVMRPLFDAILKLSVRYQDKATIVRLRNEWVEVDPRSWNADMDAEIKVGLGTGTKAERFTALITLKSTMEALMAQGSPLVTPKEYREVLVAVCEMLGYKDTTRFIRDLSDEDLAKQGAEMQAQQQQQAQQQLQLQLAAKEGEARIKTQSEAALEQQKSAHEAEIERLRLASAERLARLEGELAERQQALQQRSELQVVGVKAKLEEQKMLLDHELKMREQDQELRLERARMVAGDPAGQGNLPTVLDS